MDTFNKLSTPAKLVLGATVLFLIVSFFNWFSVEDLGGVSMWEGIGTLAGILAIAVLVWEGLRLANVDIKLPISHAMVSVVLTLLVLLFAFIRFIDKPGGLNVDDCAAVLEGVKDQGARVVDEHPRTGSRGTTVAFLHPKTSFGTLIELVEE